MKRQIVIALLAFVAATAFAAEPPIYLPGGKLAGVELPLYPTHHGEPAGFPGSIPELAEKAAAERQAEIAAGADLELYNATNLPFSPQGMAPKMHLYDGSVEHFSAYFFKYLPIRSMYDRQSLLKNWRATEFPATAGRTEPYAEPVYWMIRHGNSPDTGYRNDPVDVVRTNVDSPAFELDCGVLEPGMYCLRVVGAVEKELLTRHRLPLIMRMTVNDTIDNGTTTYRMRAPYVDEFYSVVEFYFHAPEKRAYHASIAVDNGSMVDLLVYNLDLHDALAGSEKRPIKQRRTISADQQYVATPVPNTPELLAQEALVWNSYPPLNSHTGYDYGMEGNDHKSNWPNMGAAGMSKGEIHEKYGRWTMRHLPNKHKPNAIAVNKTLDLVYTMDDYRAGRPLPDPYPFKDSGLGVFTQSENPDEPSQNFWPVADAIGNVIRTYTYAAEELEAYTVKGDTAVGRMAALRLIRASYNLPASESRTSLHTTIVQPGPWDRDHGNRRRDAHRQVLEVRQILRMVEQYDTLYDVIAADMGLAESVGRFIPWVKTPEDVIMLMDTYLVQNTAKRLLRYQIYSSNTPQWILTPVNCLGDNTVTKPWVEWLFSSAFVYPLPPSGLQDLIITGNDRNGVGYIASHMYAHGEQSAKIAAYLDDYVDQGGLEEFNLGDPIRFPKPLAACHWFYDSRTAGNYSPRIGDVTGPDKRYGHMIVYENYKRLVQQSIQGWRWSKDPKFAWAIASFGDESAYTPEKWEEIVAAAATVKRAPWYENRSRVLSSWGGFLESGVEFDDDRYRRSVMIRTGSGWGHQHNDSLDLQVHALGYPMTIDGGQRGGYTTPGDRNTSGHNMVMIDHRQWLAHSWINAMSDVEDASYMRAESLDPERGNVRLYSRQVALIDVDEGAATDGVIPADRKFGPEAPAANSYVFDVQRVAGGNRHVHGFHAMLEDELVTNVVGSVGPDAFTDSVKRIADRYKRDIEGYPQSSKAFAGQAPEVLQATWRMEREQQNNGSDRTEATMHPEIWNPDSPRKYTRMHLFGQQGAEVVSGWSYCIKRKYGWTNLHTQVESETELESVFPAIIEPFAGEPIITSRKMVPIADNDTDAQRAVALQVTTTNGHHDLLLADGHPGKIRTVGDSRFAAEFAYVSTDDSGLRLATLTGGKLLDHPLVRLTPAKGEHSAKVIAVDYLKKQFQLDAAWPAAPLLANTVFEVGVPGHQTAYTTKSVESTNDSTTITVTEGAQFYLSRVLHVDPATRRVTCAIGIPMNEKRPLNGIDRHWIASNEEATKFWRADYLGDIDGTSRFSFTLDGPVTAADFPTKGFRLWEYGIGDTVRQSSTAAIHRRADGSYAITATTALSVALPGTGLQMSHDGTTWKTLPSTQSGGKAEASLTISQLANKVLLRPTQ